MKPKLREWRKLRGLSQVELEEKTGVAQDSISAIELGKRKPHTSTLRKFAVALDVDIEDLYHDPTAPPARAGTVPKWGLRLARTLEAAKSSVSSDQELRRAKIALEGARAVASVLSSDDLTAQERESAEKAIGRLLALSDRCLTRASRKAQAVPEPDLDDLLDKMLTAASAA